MAGEADTLRALRAQGFECETGQWEFTLPAVRAWLYPDLDLPAFLRLLYGGTLNRALGLLGAEIVVVDNRGKVTLSRYRLQPLGAIQSSRGDLGR